jgi:phosphatidylinositol phospholipase C, delta
MEQFNYSDADEDKWLTITYLADEKYKTLHLVALTSEDFKSFYETLERLRALRMAMLSLPSDPHLPQIQHPEPPETKNPNRTTEANGVDTVNLSPKLLPVHGSHKYLTNEQRQNLWERHYWKGADVSVDGRVDLQEIKRMAHRLSIDVLSQDLESIFNETHHSGGAGMNFEEFKMFWRRLRTRGDIQIIWNRLTGDDKLTATFETFERFMRTEQKVSLQSNRGSINCVPDTYIRITAVQKN